MLTFPGNVRLFLASEPVDCRKSFNGLAAIVEGTFNLPSMSGDLFVFLNRRANQVRLLFWDRDGFCLVAKRLEAGTFRRVRDAAQGQAHLEIDAADLSMLLEGVDAKSVRRHKRFKPPIGENTNT
jgi:transposase